MPAREKRSMTAGSYDIVVEKYYDTLPPVPIAYTVIDKHDKSLVAVLSPEQVEVAYIEFIKAQAEVDLKRSRP